jgi:hypothetical protein
MDIVERLLSGEDGLEYAAVDEIERLRAQVAMMRKALKEIIGLPDWEGLATPSDYARGFMGGRYGPQMIARAALATGGERE